MDHLRSMHPDQYKLQREIKGESNQLEITAAFATVPHNKRLQSNVAKAFAGTTLPMNIFRSTSNKSFLNSIVALEKIPDYKTIQKELQTLEEEQLLSVKSAEYFGIQLDHWTSNKRETVIVIIISWITSKWQQRIQTVEFKVVSRTTAWVTADEVTTVIAALGLSPRKLVGFQSDNCSAMIASAR